MKKYVNLLDLGKQKSESNAPEATVPETNTSISMVNTEFGKCPKCQKSMSSALITNNEPVYYCESCRVALPMPNAA